MKLLSRGRDPKQVGWLMSRGAVELFRFSKSVVSTRKARSPLVHSLLRRDQQSDGLEQIAIDSDHLIA